MSGNGVPLPKETYGMISTVMLSTVASIADERLIDGLVRDKEDDGPIEVRKDLCLDSIVKVFEHVIHKMDADAGSWKVFRPELICAMHMVAHVRNLILLITDNDAEIHKAVYTVARENGLSLDECEIVYSGVNSVRKQFADVISGEVRCLLCGSKKIRFNQHDFDKCCVDKDYNDTNYKPTLQWLLSGFNSPYMS